MQHGIAGMLLVEEDVAMDVEPIMDVVERVERNMGDALEQTDVMATTVAPHFLKMFDLFQVNGIVGMLVDAEVEDVPDVAQITWHVAGKDMTDTNLSAAMEEQVVMVTTAVRNPRAG